MLGIGVLALIDRNFQGLGRELFTEAGKYVIHFGESPESATHSVAQSLGISESEAEARAAAGASAQAEAAAGVGVNAGAGVEDEGAEGATGLPLKITAMAKRRTGIRVVPTALGEQLVCRLLNLTSLVWRDLLCLACVNQEVRTQMQSSAQTSKIPRSPAYCFWWALHFAIMYCTRSEASTVFGRLTCSAMQNHWSHLWGFSRAAYLCLACICALPMGCS